MNKLYRAMILVLAAGLSSGYVSGADFQYAGFSEVKESAAAPLAAAGQPGLGLADAAPAQDPACSRDLSHGVVVAFSGGPLEEMNTPELLGRLDEYIAATNSDPLVGKCSGGAGLAYKVLENQKAPHIHQSKWSEACKTIKDQKPTGPIIIAGYSMGGAAAVSLARCLNEGGQAVDLLLTLDSVPTGNDLGSVYSVPPNVKLNVNLYQVPNAATFLLPFPFGHANKREDGGSPENIINAGMHYDEPAGAAHHHLIYSFSGGPKSEGNAYSRPFALRDVSLAMLKGASQEEMAGKVIGLLEGIAAVDKIAVSLSGAVNREIPTPRN
jgi:hypothetical protein